MNSSVLGFAALAWRGSYNSTKFAMEGWADTLRLELAGTGIHVILIEPGPVTSLIRENSVPHYEKWIDPEKSPRRKEYKNRLEKRLYRPTIEKPDMFELPASAVTSVVIDALTLRNPRPRYRITTPTKVFAVLKRLLSTRMLDRILLKV
jgi:NAD(P)-dependent dehydrogenase (short-subunit alcohol dehydrogenase family)